MSKNLFLLMIVNKKMRGLDYFPVKLGMVKSKRKLENDVYPVPEEIDMLIAREKLAAMGFAIDKLTPEQKKYLASWTMGT